MKKEKIKLEKVLLIGSLLFFISCFVPKINRYEFPEIYSQAFNIKNNDVDN